MAESSGLEGGAAAAPEGVLARALAFKKKLKDGGTVIGAWVTIPDPSVTEIMGKVGFDYLMIDTEHSPFDLQALQTMMMALNGSQTVPLVRVAWNDHVRIKQLLDMGVEGILAPMVRTVQDCRDLVAACRYPPVGTRGFGPKRASNYYRDIDAYVAAANDAIFVMPQIEHIETVDVLDEFLSVPGIDAVAIGPNDLSGTAGLLRQLSHPTVKTAHETIVAKAAAHGIPLCLGVNTPASQNKEWEAKGVRVLMVTSDIELLAGGGSAALRATREALAT
ncbi:MAG TPA: aldolase/citrate lyase family protein [Geminicoccus sp.]|uniref:HpcH/HpaI aldolase family protein n=1 Tax=Geminicoccus sp. TaxID=2024832 RepID=UPI002E3363E3|nr:aldolase/citrate lyase family protein [Geminicoccus sp.]HEX2529438.1 aldolase/citrate lyase family protein [Geminicoccus sp.]